MHENVDISRQLRETRIFLDTVLLTQQGSTKAEGKFESIVTDLAADILSRVIFFRYPSKQKDMTVL